MDPEQKVYCRHLRAKNPYGMMEGGEHPWYLLDDSNTIFWCVKGHGGIGPDNDLIAPPKCLPGRSCYQPPRMSVEDKMEQ
ncbi:MAG: hypothetical protein H6561_17260 [Lewinellaceae bacterium]|nr:hypothetical protein [Lewinellaceae bacterium]